LDCESLVNKIKERLKISRTKVTQLFAISTQTVSINTVIFILFAYIKHKSIFRNKKGELCYQYRCI